jgi:hypothetical protein
MGSAETGADFCSKIIVSPVSMAVNLILRSMIDTYTLGPDSQGELDDGLGDGLDDGLDDADQGAFSPSIDVPGRFRVQGKTLLLKRLEASNCPLIASEGSLQPGQDPDDLW